MLKAGPVLVGTGVQIGLLISRNQTVQDQASRSPNIQRNMLAAPEGQRKQKPT